MTVKELMDVATYCDIAEIIVRKEGHGQWMQGYRIGENAVIYPSELTSEIRELKELKEYTSPTIALTHGEEVELSKNGIIGQMPMKIICKSCHKLPDYIGKLEVCSFQPRHVPGFHKEQLTHNEFALEIECYPNNYEEIVEIKESKNKELPVQMNITDYIEETV